MVAGATVSLHCSPTSLRSNWPTTVVPRRRTDSGSGEESKTERVCILVDETSREDVMATPHLRAAELDTTDLEDLGPLALPLAAPLGDPMPTHGRSLYETDDGSVLTGT